jgi:hypothetical protein
MGILGKPFECARDGSGCPVLFEPGIDVDDVGHRQPDRYQLVR